MKILQRTASIDKLFESTESVVKNNMNIFMRSSKDSIIIENALKKLFSNLSYSFEKSLKLWREKNRVWALEETLN